jgi:hypothetical protein
MMDALREMALESGAAVGEPEVWAFHREFLNQVKKRGRVYELEFMMRYKLASRSFFQDMGAGLKMMLRGRFQLLPTRIREMRQIRRIMEGGNGAKR